MFDFSTFYKGKRVLITGNTGFKGTWLTKILVGFDADILGFSLYDENELTFWNSANIQGKITNYKGDIRDLQALSEAFEIHKPEIVFHLAAQPLVRESYRDPVYTYETNVMGTVNLLECIRKNEAVKSVVNITTDKVYENKEWIWGYREYERLNGFDPYSNSKSCSELATSSYINSFFKDRNIAVSTARAGNVVGGGDFSKDRIIPDCVRAALKGEEIIIRNPYSIRPYQHVLEPLSAYLLIAAKQYDDKSFQGNYNVGPLENDCITNAELVDCFCKKWGDNIGWKSCVENNAPHEASFLRLDCSKIRNELGWKPKWSIEKSIACVCEFSKKMSKPALLEEEMQREIEEYFSK